MLTLELLKPILIHGLKQEVLLLVLTGGWNNSFSWKRNQSKFLIGTARIGGVGVSATQAKMDYYGTSKASAIARDNGGVPVNNGKMNAEDFYKVVGSYWEL